MINGNDDKSIMVGKYEDKVYAKIIGRGTALNSHSLKDFIFEMIAEKYFNFTVDFEKCNIIDSTFIGTLFTIHNHLESLGYSNALELINLSHSHIRTLDMIGVTKFIPYQKKGDTGISNMKYLENRDYSRLESVEHVYNAHELLGRISDENKARFKYVSQFMKEERERLS